MQVMHAAQQMLFLMWSLHMQSVAKKAGGFARFLVVACACVRLCADAHSAQIDIQATSDTGGRVAASRVCRHVEDNMDVTSHTFVDDALDVK